MWATAANLPAVPQLTPAEDKGTFLGVLFSPVPEALADQMPQLPRNQGVLITHILPDSPGARADLRRHDILLAYQGEKIRNCEHLVQLIQDDKPNRKVKLQVVRGGKEIAVEVTLGLGPILRVAAAKTAPATVDPKGVAKHGPPAAVNVVAQPLDQGKMKVAIEYYQEGTGRLRTITCEGSLEQIDGEVKKLPDRERTLVQAALQRLKQFNSAKPAVTDR
jgi:hypothetical protein